MKTTVYFTPSETPNYAVNEVHLAIESAVSNRDKFLEENKKDIGKIDDEDIKVISVFNGQQILVVIKLSYYPK
jgi:hypothetical protein